MVIDNRHIFTEGCHFADKFTFAEGCFAYFYFEYNCYFAAHGVFLPHALRLVYASPHRQIRLSLKLRYY